MRYELSYRYAGTDQPEIHAFEASSDEEMRRSVMAFLGDHKIALGVSMVCLQPVMDATEIDRLKRRPAKAA